MFYAKQNKELFSPLSWLIYHPQDAEIVKVEMNEGIRTATVIQKENIPYDTSVKRSDFMLSEEGRYMLQVNSKQAYLLDNVPDATIFIKTAYLKLNQLHENNDFISLSYEQNTGRNYLFDKQSGISQSDEMVLDQYFDGDVASVVDVVEKQLGLAMCEYNDYDSTKDIPACLEIEWTRNGLEEVEDRLIYSAFHVNEDGKLVLDVYVKVYGFRDHVESVVLE